MAPSSFSPAGSKAVIGVRNSVVVHLRSFVFYNLRSILFPINVLFCAAQNFYADFYGKVLCTGRALFLIVKRCLCKMESTLI